MSAKIDEALEALDNITENPYVDGTIPYTAHKEAVRLSKEKIRTALESMKWRDIESAPHGVWILIYTCGIVTQACWNSNGWWDTFNGNRIDYSAAECWQPMPQPPESEEV